jgi:hypothetical protein
MSTLRVDKISPYQSSSILIEGDVLQANAATTGSNTFTGVQTISSDTATTEIAAGVINMYANTGNEDTFKVEVADGGGVKFTDWNGAATESFLEVGTNSGDITISRDTTVSGNLTIVGNLTATQYIVSSSVSHITTSFSSGSTKFGDSVDDKHEFTGSVSVDGSITGSLSFNNLTDTPTLVSGSSQVSFDSIVDKPTLVSGSSQISYPDLSNIPNGIISSSAQIDLLFDIDGLVSGSSQVVELLPNGTVSGSSQITYGDISSIPNDIVSSSAQVVASLLNQATDFGTGRISADSIGNDDGTSTITGSFVGDGSGLTGIPGVTPIDTGSYATTGSNTFIGNQTITGSLFVTGSFEVVGSVTASVVSSSYIKFDSLPDGTAPSYQEGLLYYDNDMGALTFYNNKADISLQIGQEQYIRAINKSGDDILNGTPVRVSGSQGDRVKIYKAEAFIHTGSYNVGEAENHIVGITTHDILNDEDGYVTILGLVKGINTNNYEAGDILYVQTGSAGVLTNIAPPFPYDKIQVGIVGRKHPSVGEVLVLPKEPTHFGNITGLSGSLTTEVGDLWVYKSNNAWATSKTLSGSYQIDNGDLSISSGSIVIHTNGEGIDFSSTSGSGATSAVFDGYEEGTWTMGVTFGGNNVDVAYTYNTGRYTKVGNMVTVTGYLLLSSKGTSNGDAVITGLPYTIPNDASYTSPATLYLGNVGYANYPMAVGAINTTTIALQEVTEAGAVTNLTDAEFGNNAGISITLTYFV